MSKPINLNQARKARARAAAKAQANENALRFGRTAAQKRQENAAKAKADTALDGHKRQDSE